MCKSLFKRRFLNRYDKVKQMKVCVCVLVWRGSDGVILQTIAGGMQHCLLVEAT